MIREVKLTELFNAAVIFLLGQEESGQADLMPKDTSLAGGNWVARCRARDWKLILGHMIILGWMKIYEGLWDYVTYCDKKLWLEELQAINALKWPERKKRQNAARDCKCLLRDVGNPVIPWFYRVHYIVYQRVLIH